MLVRRLFTRSAAARSAVQAAIDPPASSAFACPVCDVPMSVGATAIPAEFAAIAIEEHDLECPYCGMLARRLFHPSVGYDAGLVR